MDLKHNKYEDPVVSTVNRKYWELKYCACTGYKLSQ